MSLPPTSIVFGSGPDDQVSVNGLTLWREQRGMSQAELARKLGVSRSTIMRWESGEREGMGKFNDSHPTLLRLALENLDETIPPSHQDLEPLPYEELREMYREHLRLGREIQANHQRFISTEPLGDTTPPPLDVKAFMESSAKLKAWNREHVLLRTAIMTARPER